MSVDINKVFPDLKINLQNKRKAIIGIGCSFVQAQGALEDELYDTYNWNREEYIKHIRDGVPFKIIVNDNEKREILNKYKNVKLKNNELDFTYMQYENSFLNVLCKKYLDSYVPINLGIIGCGNRASIKELHFSQIDWNSLNEIIVIYCPTGMERFDFISGENDVIGDSTLKKRWKTVWPNFERLDDNKKIKPLWEAYQKHVYNEKFQVFEQIINAKDLLTWCSLYKARLIITPAFDLRYNKDYFINKLRTRMRKNNENFSFFNSGFTFSEDHKYADLFPWDKIFKPQGYETFAHFIMSKEDLNNKEDWNIQFEEILGNGSKNKWFTPCMHPGKKAHELFAKELHKYII